MKRLGKIRKSIIFGSGRIAARRGERVTVEVGRTTVWIYDIPTMRSPQLLYTFRSKKKAREHVVLIKESKS